MSHKMDHFSPVSVIPAIEESLREYWSNYGHTPPSEIYESHGLVRVYTGVPISFLNGVSSYALPFEQMDEAIEESIRFYQKRNAVWEWMVGPQPSPVSLLEALGRHGMETGSSMTGMAAQLDSLELELPFPKGMQIIPVEDVDALRTWVHTAVTGFEIADYYEKFMYLESSIGYQPHYRRYLAILDQKPVTTASVYLGKNVAGIYTVATVPAARQQGLGAAITLRALREASAEGYHIAVLHASSMGRRVYEKLGFQVFSTINGYLPAKEKP
jgi:ribosomal protein S18 acetylase RimI-like enzyme